MAQRRARTRVAPTLPEALLWISLGATLILGPQLLGGVQPTGILFHTAGALCALISAIWVTGSPLRLPWLFWGVLSLWLWTALPAVPLPCSLTAILAPEATAQAKHAYSLTSDAQLPYCTLSADPGNTRLEVLKWTAILAIFLCAEVLSRTGRRRKVLVVVGLAGALMSLIAMAHMLAAADRIFGVYTPEYGRQRANVLLLAPLVNFNNLAGFVLLTGTVQFGLARAAADDRRRYMWYGLSGLSAVTVAMTLSRAGVAALVGVIILLGLKELAARNRHGRRGAGDALPWLFAGGVAFVLYIVSEPLLNEFQAGGWDKFELWKHSLPLLTEEPLLGLGRGSFAAVFARMYGTTHRFKYTENFVLQWGIEWGIPVTLALLTAIGLRLLRSLQRRRRSKQGHRTAAAVAVLAFAGQNLFDLALEVVSCACIAAAALGTLSLRKSDHSDANSEQSRGFFPIYFALPGVLALLLLGPGAVANHTQTIERQLDQAATPTGRLTKETEALLVRGLRLHPQEPLLVYYGAKLLLAKDDQRAPRMINYLLELAPGWAGAHVLAARFLVKQGRIKQAVFQLREAAERDPRKSRELACLIANKVPSLALNLLPKDPEQLRRVMINLVYCLPMEHPAQAELDRMLMAGYPDEQVAFVRQSDRMRKNGDFEGAERLLRNQLNRDERKEQLWGALAQLYVHMAEPQKALDTISRAESNVAPTMALLAARAQAYALMGDIPAMEDAWSLVQGKAAGQESDLAYAYWLLGQLETTVGRRNHALSAFVEAYKLNEHTSAAVGAARVCEQLGDRERALSWWQKACLSDPNHPLACESARRLQGGRLSTRAE